MMNDYDLYTLPTAQVTQLSVGETYLVSTQHAVSPMIENCGMYPWGGKRTKVPVKILNESERFWTAEVQPHYCGSHSLGLSKPYTVTIDKWEFHHREILAWKYDSSQQKSF